MLQVYSGKLNRAEVLQLFGAHFSGGLDEEDDEDFMTALALAIFSNDLISVEQLILLGARVSQAIIYDIMQGPFTHAIDSNNITLMKLLRVSGEDPDEGDANAHSSPTTLALALSKISGGTPLSRAASCRDIPIIQLLFGDGAEIIPKARHEAPQKGCPHVATHLLKHPAREERTLQKQLAWHPPFSIGVKGAMDLFANSWSGSECFEKHSEAAVR
ncbi:hypothetical protein ACJ73_09462 [Blastomyces percursus]|uniref:Uncharacterized protein n=1 Tax=Blastomyces percursus TaxID=1658174 RepID=A0A1J9Q9G9_9EURO|nr:hypothetical protein ACJ73_09462 [Blastomyces percursus]